MSKSSHALLRVFVSTVLAVTVLSTVSFAASSDRIAGALNAGQSVALRGNVHPNAAARFDRGPAEPGLRFGSITMETVPTAAQQKEINRLLAEQQDRKSPNFHKWLTPEKYADRFGLSVNDVRKITDWLKGQGFTGIHVARARNWIRFQGNALQVQSAFGTEIHRFKVNGELHVANATSPKVPAALAGIVSGIHGLDDFHLKPRAIHHAKPAYFSSALASQFVAPGDLSTIYDIPAAGVDGTGQTMVVIGQTDINLADLNDFRSGFGLSSITCTTNASDVITSCSDAHLKYVVVAGLTDPAAPLTTGDLSEADLDLELAGAVASGAQIIYDNAPATFNGTGGLVSGGVWVAWHDAVDNNVAPVISMSYGLCEFGFSHSVLGSGDETELQFANLQGQTFVNSTGDTGAAGCDVQFPSNPSFQAQFGYGVGYPASSPEVTAVGGTSVSIANLGSTTLWNGTNGADGGSAAGPIPEQPWNDVEELGAFCAANTTNAFCQANSITDAASAQALLGLSATGSGPSNCATQNAGLTACVSGFPQPPYQSSLVLTGQAAVRYTPDVSLLASPNFPGYIFCTQQSELGNTGTGSACAPGGAAGITNALAQNTPPLIGGTSASAPVFAGMVVLLNQYLSATGGLGNINPTLYQLAATPSNLAFNQMVAGDVSDNILFCVPGSPGSPQAAFVDCPSSGAAAGTLGFQMSPSDATTGYNLVTGLGSVDFNNLATAWLATVNGFSTSAAALSPTPVPAGTSTSTTITFTPSNGFTGTITPSCSGLPTGASCTFNPTTVDITDANPQTTNLTISTLANTTNGTTTVTVRGSATGAPTSSTTVSLDVTATGESFTLTSDLTGGTLLVTQGATGTVNLTVNSTSGFVVSSGGNSATDLPVTYTCAGLPSESTCTFSPGSPTSSTTVSVSVKTTAATAKLEQPFSRSGRIFYAALLPGFFGILFIAGSSKGSQRGLRMLGLMLVLGISTMWMGACGGSNNSSGGGNPGTPKGSYPVTINATTGGGTPITSSLQFTLTVQ